MWACFDDTSSDDDDHNTSNALLLLCEDALVAPVLLAGPFRRGRAQGCPGLQVRPGRLLYRSAGPPPRRPRTGDLWPLVPRKETTKNESAPSLSETNQLVEEKVIKKTSRSHH